MLGRPRRAWLGLGAALVVLVGAIVWVLDDGDSSSLDDEVNEFLLLGGYGRRSVEVGTVPFGNDGSGNIDGLAAGSPVFRLETPDAVCWVVPGPGAGRVHRLLRRAAGIPSPRTGICVPSEWWSVTVGG